MKATDVGSPTCNMCDKPAKYDEPVSYLGSATWAYTCEEHHVEFGLGNDHLGTEFTS